MKIRKMNEYSSSIVPARIKEARIARGFSLTELSELIGVSSQAISKYELGSIKPSTETMMRIIRVLDFPMRYFTKPMVIETDSTNSSVFFRAKKSTTKKNKEALKIRIKWADEIYRYLEKYIEFPEIDIPDFTDFLVNDISNETIEEVALKLREHWGLGLGPIDNLVELLESKGIIITRAILTNKKVEAFSQWYNNKPYVVLGNDIETAVRLRFSLAHELAHLILHTHISEEDIKKKDILDRIEEEANRFAGAFLLPITTFPTEVLSSSLNHFIQLKKRWKVSLSAMIKRVEQLEYLTENQIRYLKSQMTRKKYWRKEPLDDILINEIPEVFKEAVDLLFDNDIIVSQDLIDQIAFNIEDISTLSFISRDKLRIKSPAPQMKLRTI